MKGLLTCLFIIWLAPFAAAECTISPSLNIFGIGAIDQSSYLEFCTWAQENNGKMLLPLVVVAADDPDCPEGGEPTWECDPTWDMLEKGSVSLVGVSTNGFSISNMNKRHATFAYDAVKIPNDVGVVMSTGDMPKKLDEEFITSHSSSSVKDYSEAIIRNENIEDNIKTGRAFYFIAVKGK